MNIALWIVAIVLAGTFVSAGALKLARPKEKLAETGLAWTEDFSQNTIRLIAVAEILGGLGLILPAVTKIAPILVPLAAVGLAIIMVGAAITHVRRHEPQMVIVNVVLFVLAVFVAWGRFGAWAF